MRPVLENDHKARITPSNAGRVQAANEDPALLCLISRQTSGEAPMGAPGKRTVN